MTFKVSPVQAINFYSHTQEQHSFKRRAQQKPDSNTASCKVSFSDLYRAAIDKREK